MRLSPSSKLVLTRFSLLFALLLLCSKPGDAQSKMHKIDFQIMVNGPWSYVTDPQESCRPKCPGKRILLVAPTTPNHEHHVYVFHNDDASHYGHPPSCPRLPCEEVMLQTGIYSLDFDFTLAGRTFAGHPSPDSNYVAPRAYNVSQWVTDHQIKSVLNSANSRFAISLPEPDYYSEYWGDYGDGPSESIISPHHINSSADAQPAYYTTWMVLHYEIDAMDGSAVGTTLSGRPDGLPSNISNTFQPTAPYAVSITLGVPHDHPGDQLGCDSLSGATFTASKHLWRLSLYARFPAEKDSTSGTQLPGQYDYTCPEGGTGQAETAQAEFATATSEDTAKAVKQALDNLKSAQSVSKGGKNVKDASSVSADIKTLRTAFEGLSLGRPWPEVTNSLDCLEALSEGHAAWSCSGDAPKDQLVKWLIIQYNNLAAGGTDCHQSQLNVNSTIQ